MKWNNVMEKVQIETFTVYGLTLRTANSLEMNPETANIPKHVQLVDSNIEIDYLSDARAYSVYTNYESDVNGFYDLLMGSTEIASAKRKLQSIDVVAGEYLKFDAEGEFPDAIIRAWQTAWAYFSSQDCKHSRAYTTDFEYYQSTNQVSVFIALK
ncbi:GyrI-like domain-containing protein [Photobacterium leiognathi]|nr:GyrI-like domain-containing protein [Photobacterium leiognathi]